MGLEDARSDLFALGAIMWEMLTGRRPVVEAAFAQVAESYGSSHARLTKLKRQYDPKNLLRYNQNVAP